MKSPRQLSEALSAYRIGDPHGTYPIWSAQGARLVSGRWHRNGTDVIYTSECYSTAMLEKLVHFSGQLPANQHFIKVHIPAGTSYEVVTGDSLPGWASVDGDVARGFAAKWYAEGRSCLLIVPSVVAREERNFVINSRHPDFVGIKPGLETPVWWDKRLFE